MRFFTASSLADYFLKGSMKSKLPVKRVLLYGFLLWLIPFIVGFIAFPAKGFFAPLFETIMAITLTLCGAVFAILYFKKLGSDFLRQGVLVGAIWFAMSVLIDLPLFLLDSPMKMSFPNYMMDIGLTYLIYPIVTVGFGLLLAKK
jgi:hypothetical protein